MEFGDLSPDGIWRKHGRGASYKSQAVGKKAKEGPVPERPYKLKTASVQVTVRGIGKVCKESSGVPLFQYTAGISI